MLKEETVIVKGRRVRFKAVEACGQTFIISGKLLKTATLKDDWLQDLSRPEEVARVLQSAPVRIDMLKFWQRLPETQARYSYYKEWQPIAAIPVTTFDHWWKTQINDKTRNMVRKAHKMGVTIEQAQFDDDLARGIVSIFNESPVRRGKPFWHYGKDFAAVKRDLSDDLDKSVFIAARFQQELIGYIKLLMADRYAMVTMILDKKAHRDKSPSNGLIAKAVEICAKRDTPFITFTTWQRGDYGRFQKHNGFQPFPVPEYYVPLTMMGRLALCLRLHQGPKAWLPQSLILRLLALRARWYAFRLRQRAA